MLRHIDERCLLHHTLPVLPAEYGEELSYLEDISKLIKKINSIVDRVNNISDEIFDRCKAYTDEEIAKLHNQVRNEIQTAKTELENEIEELELEINNFEYRTNITLDGFRQDLSDYKDSIDEKIAEQDLRISNIIASMMQYTDAKVAELRNEIINKAQELIDNIKVTNMFTGARVSIQAMFDYLGNLHTEGAVLVQTIADLERTVNAVIGYDETVTNYIVNGDDIFNER